jgi:uncharacterized protein
MADPWYANGIRFKCTQCGVCCHAKGELAYVYVNQEERRRIAGALEKTLEEFASEYIAMDGRFYLLKFKDGKCIFLNEDNSCRVQEVKPTQCLTFPFHHDFMQDEESYEKYVRSYCPGSKDETAPLHDLKEISEQSNENAVAKFIHLSETEEFPV